MRSSWGYRRRDK